LYHACASRADGSLWCWGANWAGQLGDGTTESSPEPVETLPPGSVGPFAAGGVHSCAARAEGDGVLCWGRNDTGQLGDGGTADGLNPTPVSGSIGAVMALAAGVAHTCAITSDQSLWCWGRNDRGQLGSGTISSHSSVPVQVPLSNVMEVAVGDGHTCAISDGGRLWCWGAGDEGQLGVGSAGDSAEPVRVASVQRPVELAAGSGHSCARLEEDRLYCWGRNRVGQVGNGTTENMMAPVQIFPPGSTARVSAGFDHTCARKTDGTLWCWGSGKEGQLGTGASGELGDRSTPDQVLVWPGGPALAPVDRVVAAGWHTFAFKDDGTLWCWGLGDEGQCGNGITDRTVVRRTPVPVRVRRGGPPLTEVASASAGANHTCARMSDDSVRCWGGNLAGALGDSSTDDRLWPVSVRDSGGDRLAATRLASALLHSCASGHDGALWCWGEGRYGQLGNGDTDSRTAPLQAQVLAGAIDVDGGDRHTCALASDEQVWCWGNNAYGQLGDGDVAASLVPVRVRSSLSPATALYATRLAVGRFHSCARARDDSVWCWGHNGSGQLGDSSENRSLAAQVPDLAGAGELSAGGDHTCAQVADQVRCWGSNRFGQLGDGTTVSTPTPVLADLTAPVIQLAVGGQHTCGLQQDGGVSCWGDNSWGQLGNGETAGSAKPVPVPGLTGVTSLTAGALHSCGRKDDGTLWCWGADARGQLGDGSSSRSAVPVLSCPR
jgi:alpha-tubulin suppressor-like RCC1 family protein